MPTNGLSVSGVVKVDVAMSPLAAQERNFGSLLIVGDSNVIDVQERMRLYTSIDGIAADFGSSAPEYRAALLYYSQSPQPLNCYVGRWARTATSGTLRGAPLSSAQQAIGNFNGIANGGLNVSIDGVVRSATGIDLTAQTNLNGVAAALQTALSAWATVQWDANNGRFIVRALSTGATSGVSFASAPGSGTDLSVLMGLRATSSGAYSVAGVAAETLLAAVQRLGELSNAWYGLQVAASVTPSHSDYSAVAQYIEAAGVTRIFGVTTQEGGALDAAITNDLASVLKALNLKRTFTQYSSTEPFASASIFGRAFTVDFDGSNTTITLKFKQQPSVAAELLTETQAAALNAKNCNVFVRYNNDTAILQQGVMSNGYFFDEVHGFDWLQNALQTDQYNLLYTSTTKVSQTEAGNSQRIARATAIMEQAVANGLVAPGVWNGPPVGALDTGDTLSTGFYVYCSPIATQPQADREGRKGTLMQIACKQAGAVHFSNVLVSVNR